MPADRCSPLPSSAAAVGVVVPVLLPETLLEIEVAAAGDIAQLSPGDCRRCTGGGDSEVERGLDIFGSEVPTFGWRCCSDRCDLESGDRGEVELCCKPTVC